MAFAEKIRKLRKKNGLSQEELADKLDVSRQAVSKWEKGVMPDINNMTKIATFFDCTIDYLVNDGDISATGVKGNENRVVSLEKSEKRFSVGSLSTLITFISSLSIAIIWILSKSIKVPLSHQDYESGNYYTGPINFIDYYDLRGLFYICIVLFFMSIFVQTIWRLYILPQKGDSIIGKKMKYTYLIRFLLFVLGGCLFIYGVLNPWKFDWNLQNVLLLAMYLITISYLTIRINYHKKHN